jgi:hypothetical protein
VTVEVNFCARTEHVPICLTWEDYLDKRGLGHIRHLTFYDLAKKRDLTRGATLEAMGYRGGKLAVMIRWVMGGRHACMGRSPSSDNWPTRRLCGMQGEVPCRQSEDHHRHQ